MQRYSESVAYVAVAVIARPLTTLRHADAVEQLILALLASCLTVYLSSSTHHVTSKDSTFLLPLPSQKVKSQSSPKAKDGTERQPLLNGSPANDMDSNMHWSEPPRKAMYYAAGSGIPEIKTILSGMPNIAW